LIVNKGKKLGFLPEENISISQVINNPKLLAHQEFGEIIKFNAIDKLEDQEIEQLLESGQKVIMGLKAELEKSKKTIKDCQDDLLPYLYLIRRIKAAKKWHETLKRREFGQVEIELPKETPLLKKLRDAVQFMCFWKGIEYADVCVDAIGNYLPIKETCERHLRLMLRKGKCDLKPTYNFEVTIDGKIQFLSHKQVMSRLEKGNFWLSREKYRLFNDREYYDYK
jgi:hypothetical protein